MDFVRSSIAEHLSRRRATLVCRLRLARPPSAGRRGRPHHRRVVPAHAARASFDSGCLFDEELTARARDARRGGAGFASSTCCRAMSWTRAVVWPIDDALAKDRAGSMARTLPVDAGQGALGALIDETWPAPHATRIAQAGAGRSAEAMRGWIDARWRAAVPFDGRRMWKPTELPVGALAAWADDPRAHDLQDRPHPLYARGHAGGAQGRRQHRSARGFRGLQAAHACTRRAEPSISAAPACRRADRAAARRARRRRAASASPTCAAPGRCARPQRNGECRLRRCARTPAQYPVALIDELQDTSPVQSRIFDRLYLSRRTSR